MNSYPQTHPDRLSIIGRLFGMEPAPANNCRVLELGCAEGGNILPLAQNLPESEFLGIGFSARPIEAGRKLIAEAGLKNVVLRKEEDLLDFEEEGKFDYIIAQGIYSWVREEVREKILKICRNNLKAQGIAFVDYNTFPGWKMRGMLRDMLSYHAGGFEDPKDKIRQAYAFLTFLRDSIAEDKSPYGLFLKSELKQMKGRSAHNLLLDVLGESNDPLYFHQFIARAAQHDLRYLGEAEFHTMLAGNLSPEVDAVLRKIKAGIIATEQYMDFLRNRALRQTLLCHKEVTLDRTIQPEVLRDFYLASNLKPDTSPPDLKKGEKVCFRGTNKARFETADPMAKALFYLLSERFPEFLSFQEAISEARKRVQEDDGKYEGDSEDPKPLLNLLMGCYAKDIMELKSLPPAYKNSVSERPLASPLGRAQAAFGTRVTNELHFTVNVDVLNRKILTLLNGENDRKAIIEKLLEMVQSGELILKQGEVELTDSSAIKTYLESNLERNLKQMAEKAFLVG